MAIRRVLQSDTDGWKYVITPNLHHIHLLRKQSELFPVYAGAEMLLADGWPVASMLARVSGTNVERVAGSDLLEALVESQGEGRSLVLVGGEDQAALDVVQQRAELNGWKVTTEPAPFVEVADPERRNALLDRIASAGTDGVVVLGLGAPKQEIFASELANRAGRGFILCLGMAINFSAGRAARAPQWMQALRMEWLHRALQEPVRLIPRYAQDSSALIPTAVSNLRSRS
ncbi:hypothetical protein A6F58_05485 [Prescottella equi]|nr:hypothetical protein A6F58_05485 [Prescottella equi]